MFSPLQYMPWPSRVCLHTAQWCFFLKFLSLKECEPIFPNYISTHTKTSKLYSSRPIFTTVFMWCMYIWQEINPNTSANHKHDIKEHWAHMSTRPQSWWYEEHKSITHTLEVINDMYVCTGEEYCDDRTLFEAMNRYYVWDSWMIWQSLNDMTFYCILPCKLEILFLLNTTN